MTLRFIDSFDHYTSDASTLLKYGVTGSTSYVQILTTGGRRGSGGLELYGSGFVRKTLDDQGTWIIGFAYKSKSMDISSSAIALFRDSAGATQCSLYVNAGGALEIRRSNTTILATSSMVLASEVWYYIEVKINIHDTTGSAVVRVNETEVINVSGVDTKHSAVAGARSIDLNGLTTERATFDDFYICDAAGSVNNDFLGDVRVDALRPTGAGSVTEFTPSTGANWENVDDTDPDGDTTYNVTDTVGNTDLFVFGDLPAGTGDVFGVQANLLARKDDAGVRGIKSTVLLSSTEYDGAEKKLLDSYFDLYNIWELNPNTAAAWVASEINGAEFGYKVST